MFLFLSSDRDGIANKDETDVYLYLEDHKFDESIASLLQGMTPLNPKCQFATALFHVL